MNSRRMFGIVVAGAIVCSFASMDPTLAGGYPNPDPGRSASVSLPPGAYVIDAGVVTGAAVTQTMNQALKPYGLIYALVKEQIPVLWVINPAKSSPGVDVNAGGIDQALGNVGTDFVYDCDAAGSVYAARSITTGAYIIQPDFVDQAKPVIDAFRALNGGFPQPGTISGVAQTGGQILGYDPSPLAGQSQGCTTALPTTVEVFNTITGWPRTVLDTDNGAIAVDFYNNAGIPQGPLNDPANPPAYRFATPAQLTPCDDFYVMPHADPTYATHSNLRPFVEQGGYVWVGCHAVSVLENIRVNDSATQPLYLNFLATDGLISYSNHGDGSVPYSFFKLNGDGKPYYSPTYGTYDLDSVLSGDPVAQFRGRTDLAHQNGSEQIFMPGYGTDPATGAARTNWPANMADASHWREQTQIVLYDPTQSDAYPLTTTATPVKSLGPATALVYGPAYGDPNNGLVMYEGGHDINKGTGDDAAAQRAFFNMQMLNAVNRSPQVTVSQPAGGTTVSGGSTIAVSASATGGSGSFSYTWSASCTDETGAPAAGGSFADASAASTTFTAPLAASELNCNLSLSVVDSCGRFAFGGESIVVEASTPSITVSKSAVPVVVTAAGETVDYSFLVTNTGNVTLSSIVVSDPLPGLSAVACPGSTLAPSEAMTCTASYVVTQGDVDAGSIANTATVSGTPPSGPAVSDSDSATVTATPGPSITVSKSAVPVVVTAAGETVDYSFLVTNSGNVTLSSIVVSDPLPGLSAVGCPGSTLAPSEAMTCTASYVVTQGDVDAGSIANTATVSGTPPSGPAVSDSDSATVTAPTSAGITVNKTTNDVSYSSVGQTLTFTITATNTGNVTLTGVVINDPLATVGSCTPTAPATLAVAEILTCTATHVTTQADLDSGSFSNVASGSGTTPQGATVTDDSATVTVPAVQSPAVAITKSTTATSFSAVGQRLNYTIATTNSGNVTLTSVIVTDPNAVVGVCTPAAPASLAPGQSMTCTAVHTVTQADINAKSVSNSAHVAGESGATTVTGTSNVVVVPGGPPPLIPLTGSSFSGSLRLVGLLLSGGVVFLITSRRRRQFYLVLPPLESLRRP